MHKFDIHLLERFKFLGWAKVNNNSIHSTFHSIIYHLLDSAACANEIIQREPILRKIIAPFLNEIYSDSIINKIFSFFVAMHDLGKMSPGFQSSLGLKNSHLTPMQQWKSHEKYWKGINRAFHEKFNINHGFVSADSLIKYFYSKNQNLNKNSFLVHFAIAVGHHHDKNQKLSPEELFNKIEYYYIQNSYNGDSSWQELREVLIESIWEIIFENELKIENFINQFSFQEMELSPHYEVLFAGLACAADWIASNEKFFKYEFSVKNNLELINYYQEKRQQAKRILEGNIFWGNQNSQYFVDQNFKNIFKFFPRSFQNDVLSIVTQNDSASLTILEAPMGMGKTEAALSFLMSPFAKKSRGLYFALPTQATSNQMFERVNHVLNSFFQERGSTVQLQILHGNKKWNELNLELLINSEASPYLSSLNDDVEEVYDEEIQSYLFNGTNKGTLASSWHETSRTGLLAEFGVGTIDQVLRSVLLNEKHYFVKLFGLAGKTIILDEIHAYDAYMDEMISRLLEWLGHNGCQVILMSATLPKNKRENFLSAFAQTNIETAKEGFPRISSVAFQQPNSFHEKISETKDLQSKKTPLKFIEIDDYSYLVSSILNDIETTNFDGQSRVIGIVCNTVKTSQEVYKAFENYGIHKEFLILFNARFSMEIRQEKENDIKNTLGKSEFKKLLNNEEHLRPKFKIIIATQVIEQSLDIDFDFMYSFLCPVDLLLQRMGRHFRRCRWELNTNMEFKPTHFGVIHEKCDENDLPTFNLCKGTKKVYFESLLLKTYKVLKEFLSKNNNLIDDIFDLEALIQNVYNENSKYNEIQRIAKLESEMERNNSHNIKKAEAGLHYSPKQYNKISKLLKSNWFLDTNKERNKPYSINANTRLFDNSKQILIFIHIENKKYLLNNKNELEPLPNLLSTEHSDLKKIVGMLVTFPGYLINNDIINSFKENQKDLQKSKFLKYYDSLNFKWNGQYASIKYDKIEIRYCANYGLQVLKKEE